MINLSKIGDLNKFATRTFVRPAYISLGCNAVGTMIVVQSQSRRSCRFSVTRPIPVASESLVVTS